MSPQDFSGNPDDDLALASRRFQWLFHHSPNVLVVLSLEGSFVAISNSVKRVLGYDPPEVIGKLIYDFVYQDDKEKLRVILEKLGKGDNPELFEFQVICKDGSRRFLEASASDPIAEPDLSGILITARDLTKRKDLERQLLRAQRLETIGSLAGGVAHDLNNILTPVLLSLEILKKGITNEGKLRLLRIIESSVEKGRNIVKQVLTFARGVEGEPTLVQLRHLINDVVDIASQTFPPNIHVQPDIPKDSWPVRADATQIHQVFMNLLVNARDAMPDGGTITISAENLTVDESYARMVPDTQPGPYIVITVTDTGTGIEPKDLRHIFDPFFTTKEVGKGTGMGLATVKQVIDGHKGSISVESKVGSGTTFRIHLPSITTAESESGIAIIAEPPPGDGELIIVADDDESIRDITRQTLEAFGYVVQTAADGAEALSFLLGHEVHPRVLFTDFAMPIMDGRQLIKAVKKMGLDVKIMVASGTSMSEEAKLDMSEDVDIFISKPFTASKLLTTVHQMLHPESIEPTRDTNL
jgi:PAS domain S-box-containing protein